MRRFFAIFLLLFTASISMHASQSSAAGDVKAGSGSFAVVDNLMKAAVQNGAIPGGVVIVGHEGKVVFRKAYGSKSLVPSKTPMTEDTIFDLASLTKCIATTSSVMVLIQEGKIRLNDSVATYLPEFGKNGKEHITVRQLLTHHSGLREDLDLKTEWKGHDTAFKMAMNEKPVFAPGSRFLYSDINFETLGFLVERISGMSLADFSAKHVFQPLGMKETTFNPPTSWQSRIAPTQYDENHKILLGVVHDPTARRMGGVAGHAGLFSTADDLALYATDMLSGFHVLSELTVTKMSTPQQPPTSTSLRGLGWDLDSPFASNRGEFLPVGSFGHTGFTGTSVWMDPTTQSFVILLTNAVHPSGSNGGTVALRAKVASAVAQELQLSLSEKEKLRLERITGYNEAMAGARLVTSRNGHVLNGIDVLESKDFAELRRAGKDKVRIALITNHTGMDATGKRTIDVLANAKGIELAAIFSPEHGIAGAFDTTDISNSVDAATKVPIYTVYGDTKEKRHPSPDVIKSVDAIVYDIQDVGVRFYTYESTMGYFLEAAAAAGKKIYILDRPNPITGAYVQGPISDTGREDFINYSQVPIRHGMTMGELAEMYNSERKIHADLTVVKMQGWERGDWMDATGVLWINQSPNMRNLTEAVLYPGLGILESTNVSLGRGTDTPFEMVGAPWVHAVEFADYLNARGINGVRFVPTEFTPSTSVNKEKKCGGVYVVVTDRNALDSAELGLELAGALHSLYPNDFDTKKLDNLMKNAKSAQDLLSGKDPREIWADWNEAIDSFDAIRAKYLLY